MANGIAKMMQKRQQALPKNGTKYNTSKANIRNKCWQMRFMAQGKGVQK